MVGFITTFIMVAGPVFLLAGIVALVMWPRKPRARKMRGQIVEMGSTPVSAPHPKTRFSRTSTLYYCKVRVDDAYGTTLLDPWVFRTLALSNVVWVHVTDIYGDTLSVSGISRI